MARGEGHLSYVASVAFDEHNSSEACLRFASSGDDGKAILWEYRLQQLSRGLSSSSPDRDLSLNSALGGDSPNASPLVAKDQLDVASFVSIASDDDQWLKSHPNFIANPVAKKCAFLRFVLAESHGDLCFVQVGAVARHPRRASSLLAAMQLGGVCSEGSCNDRMGWTGQVLGHVRPWQVRS